MTFFQKGYFFQGLKKEFLITFLQNALTRRQICRVMKPRSNGRKYFQFSECKLILVIAPTVFELFKLKVMAHLVWILSDTSMSSSSSLMQHSKRCLREHLAGFFFITQLECKGNKIHDKLMLSLGLKVFFLNFKDIWCSNIYKNIYTTLQHRGYLI